VLFLGLCLGLASWTDTRYADRPSLIPYTTYTAVGILVACSLGATALSTILGYHGQRYSRWLLQRAHPELRGRYIMLCQSRAAARARDILATLPTGGARATARAPTS
jgi:hypothetical protein